ncbi:MAG: hypothetical protein NVS9B12_07920 [Vulcanimicrobiaceae bacterium]
MPLRVQSRVAAPQKQQNAQAKKPAAQAGTGLPFNLPQPPAGTKQLPAGVSLCMIVKNEERYLEQCLTSAAAYVDEICILDTGSTDRTIEIAQQFGARVERAQWRDDFAWARNQAVAMATKRWILMLDADEELAPASRDEILALKNVPASTTALYVRCHNLSNDYKGTGSLSHLIIRIFPNHPKVRFINPIHEYVTYEGREMGPDALLSSLEIIHHGYLKEVVAERNKAERNFALIRKLAQTNPEDAFNWYNLGMTASVVKDWEEAIVGFERMRAILKGAPRAFLPQALITLGEAYSEGRNEDEKALAILGEAIAASPKLSNAHFTKARILAKLGRVEEARSSFKDAIDTAQFKNQQFIVDDQVYRWKAQLSLGASYADEKRFDEALEWYEKGLANQPNVQPLVINKAHALEGLGRYDEAEKAFRDANELFKDETSAIQYINYMLRRREHAAAERLMEEAIDDVSPRTASTFMIARASIAQRKGDSIGERRYLERSLELCPGAGPVLDALEAFYRKGGETEKIEQLHAMELEHEPQETPDFVRRSFRLLAMERFEEAAAAALAGLKKAPVDPELRYNLAVAHVRSGNAAAALEHLAVVPAGATELGQKAAMLRATLLSEAGRPAEGIRSLDAVFAESSDVDSVLLRAKCLEQLGRIDEAILDMESIFPMERRRVGVEMASLFMRAGRFSDAQAAAERALATN